MIVYLNLAFRSGNNFKILRDLAFVHNVGVLIAVQLCAMLA